VEEESSKDQSKEEVMAKVYLAAPHYTDAEREFNSRLATAIEGIGYEVYLPQEEVLEPSQELYDVMLQNLDDSNLVVTILDGTDPDSGACFESGRAHAQQKLIVGMRTDSRPAEKEGGNMMLHYSCYQIVTNYADLMALLQYLYDTQYT
jgi:nucleoside 2-deoxyribosyltransferase